MHLVTDFFAPSNCHLPNHLLNAQNRIFILIYVTLIADGARAAVVSDELVLDICEDVGSCWDDLGIKLNLSAAVVRNVDADFRCSREKAREILQRWMEKQGDAATVGRLEDALLALEKKSIAQKLLGTWLLFSKGLIQN